MHGRKCFVYISILFFTACSPNSIMKPDCHSCTVEDQDWNAFSWNDLSGQWRGSLETISNQKGAKKEKKENRVELRFLSAEQFLSAQKMPSCGNLPSKALVLNGLLWDSPSKASTEFEAFVPVEEKKVAYGRLRLETINGQKICQFRRLGKTMGTNRLSLPAVSFSDTSPSRSLASEGKPQETELSLEFLRFAPKQAKALTFQKDGRRPASKAEEERPVLMIRVSKTFTREEGERGQWAGSEEQLYRLWKAE